VKTVPTTNSIWGWEARTAEWDDSEGQEILPFLADHTALILVIKYGNRTALSREIEAKESRTGHFAEMRIQHWARKYGKGAEATRPPGCVRRLGILVTDVR